jgi:hypothetical protein
VPVGYSLLKSGRRRKRKAWKGGVNTCLLIGRI